MSFFIPQQTNTEKKEGKKKNSFGIDQKRRGKKKRKKTSNPTNGEGKKRNSHKEGLNKKIIVKKGRRKRKQI